MVDTNETAVFVLVDLHQNKVLLEQRGARQSFANEIIFPGGSQRLGETLVETLVRETEKEELGIKLVTFKELKTSQPIMGETGRRLHIFAVTEWIGQVPTNVLDKGNELLWINFEDLEQTIKVESSRRIARLIMNKYKGS